MTPASAAATVPANIFKAYDIRGIVDETLTESLVRAIGRALGSEAAVRGESTVVVGRDGRLSGPTLLGALREGLREAGMAVVDIGCVPTPVLYYAAQQFGGGSGVMLTGSHNPPEYNGLKMVLAGETLASDTIQALRRRIEQGDLASGEGSIREESVNDAYLQRIVDDVKPQRPLKLVLDCGNGAAGELAPKLFRAMGCEVVELFCDIDGNFPNHHPDPSQPENLHDVIAAVAEHGADLGLAFDGDGDRVGVITSQGETIWPDRYMILLARDVLSRNPGAEIIFDVKCSGDLARAIEAAGGKPLMWRTGHSLIKAKMKQDGALLAGEMSGHIFFKERWYGFDDALYAAARLIEVLAADPRSTHEVFAELPNAVNTPELRVEMAEGEQHAFMERLTARAEEFFGDGELTTIDGVRVDFPDGWGLVRASNTTPCLVLRFEGRDEEVLEHLKARFRGAMLSVEQSLQLTF